MFIACHPSDKYVLLNINGEDNFIKTTNCSRQVNHLQCQKGKRILLTRCKNPSTPYLSRYGISQSWDRLSVCVAVETTIGSELPVCVAVETAIGGSLSPIADGSLPLIAGGLGSLSPIAEGAFRLSASQETAMNVGNRLLEKGKRHN